MTTPGGTPANDRAGHPVDPALGAQPKTGPRASTAEPAVDRTMTGARARDGFAATLPSGLVLLAGVWLIIAPFALGYPTGSPFWNDIVVGGVVAALALVRVALPRSVAWLSLVNAALGFWLIAAPFALGHPDTAPASVGNDVVVGVLIVVLSGTSALLTFAARADRARGEAPAR
ncbi:SPW repeat protein [Actinokineospora iranica]|uniref:SPW repeat-containing protein n=1 Tax=Actinokineospora iranica TaxID=1271860 RepID=A0A1G6U5H6_9PSEU|nr:SPW repeat protein [Actinokineospora iranica]SDD35837.1 SPW repeat-containing protein [Actinokineospora iranica]